MCSGEDGGHGGGGGGGGCGRGDTEVTVSVFCFSIYLIYSLPFSEERVTVTGRY